VAVEFVPIPKEIEDIGYQVIGCAQTTHRILGPGFAERIYQRAMCLELGAQGLPFESEKRIQVTYNGQRVGIHRLDLVIAGVVVVELKVIPRILEVHRRQVLSYLKTAGLRLGYVMNFNSETMTAGTKRIAL
jgi:GxxExxY protein